MKTDSKGFTLLELLVAAALVGAAAVVVAAAFAAGLKVVERSKQFSGYGDSVMAMELMRKDLHNAAPFRLKGFRGETSWVEIPTVVRRQEPSGEVDHLGVVRYEAGRDGHTLDRVTTVYLAPDQPEETRETMMSALEQLRFAFGDTGPDGESPVSWGDEWADPTNVPAAVRIMIGSQQNGEHREFSRLVVLPRR